MSAGCTSCSSNLSMVPSNRSERSIDVFTTAMPKRPDGRSSASASTWPRSAPSMERADFSMAGGIFRKAVPAIDRQRGGGGEASSPTFVVTGKSSKAATTLATSASDAPWPYSGAVSSLEMPASMAPPINASATDSGMPPTIRCAVPNATGTEPIDRIAFRPRRDEAKKRLSH